VKLGPAGLALIKRFEGLRLSAYLCSAGVPTIGYGHTKGVKLGDRCTVEQAEAWLLEDCQEAVDAVNRLVRVPVTQEQFDALVSFTFNLGADEDADDKAEGLGDSTLLRLLNAGDYDSAAGQFEKWVKAGGVRVEGLVRRRESERELFLCSSTSPPV
jgi:lysozyme